MNLRLTLRMVDITQTHLQHGGYSCSSSNHTDLLLHVRFVWDFANGTLHFQGVSWLHGVNVFAHLTLRINLTHGL